MNAGKNTAGVDKVLVKTPKARGELVDELSTYQPWRVAPVKRVYIPKADGKRKRPLGIPTVRDRCLQAIVKNALEPYWEAKFERTSYGFRPGRSCHDAIGRIYLHARPLSKKQVIVDADIAGAFDNIAHQPLLVAIGGFPARELIKQWLKAGCMDKETFIPTETGTPQGGVISPLLLNVALHGMEEMLGIRYKKNGDSQSKRAIVRYADDFVIFCESEEDAHQVIQQLTVWLTQRGLSLSPEKTVIHHITEGFDFLGFNIRQYPAPKTTKSGRKLLIKPSKASVTKLKGKLKRVWQRRQGANVQTMVKELNPVIRGWANYFRIGVSKKTFGQLDTWMFRRQQRYAQRTHPNKTWTWQQGRYWGKLNPARNDHWVFGDIRSGPYLLKFSWFRIRRHIPVKGMASPDDPALKTYWAQREAHKVKNLQPDIQPLAHRQWRVCYRCGESLFNGEEIHKHHLIPLAEGGKDDHSNIVLVHLYCHQQLHQQQT
jgi:RNA-directed DNA polymerase